VDFACRIRKEKWKKSMKKFVRGFLLGVGLGLLFAPLRGQDMRRLASERFQKLRGGLPENVQSNLDTEQNSGQAAHTSEAVKDDAEQATGQMKKIAGRPGGAARQMGSHGKQMGKGAVETITEDTTQTRQSRQPASSSPVPSSTDAGSAAGAPARSNPLTTIPGMEPEPLSRLEAQGIYTTQQLLDRTATKEERENLAHSIGMTPHMLRSLVDRADLMRLPGVGGDLATLLEEAGVNGCKDLQHRNPEHLYATLAEELGSQKTAPRSLALEQITRWVAEATLVAHTAQK
jgi:predicted flap endonuclease-1-like 5' DNA nuclease